MTPTADDSPGSSRSVCVSRRSAAAAIVGAALACAARAQSPAPGERVRPLRALAESLAAQGRFSGVILLAREGHTLFEQAWGWADREAARPMAVDSSMNVSSIGKLFTQAAVEQFVAAGQLSLDSTLASLWPDYPDPVAARKVTIRHLLEHRSGIDGNIFQNLPAMRRNRDYLPAATGSPLAFEPGTRQQYSNAGFVVLGEIVERLAQQDYHAHVERRVFAPAGMSATGFPSLDALPARAAVGYTRAGSPAGAGGAGGGAGPSTAADPTPRVRATAAMHGVRGSAAGGAFSNAGDLLRFLIARRSGRLGVPARRFGGRYAGGSPGSNVVIAEALPGGEDLIVLSNFDPPAADLVVDAVERSLGLGRGAAPVGGPGPEGGAAPGPQLPTLPDSPQGRAAAAYFRAFSSGDGAAMRAVLETQFVQNTRTLDERVSHYREVFEDFGALTVLGVRVASDGSFAVEARSAKRGEIAVLMSFERAAPHRIETVGFRVRR